MPLVILHHLLNVSVQLENSRGLKKMIVVTFTLRETPWVKRQFINTVLQNQVIKKSCNISFLWERTNGLQCPLSPDNSCILHKYLGEIYVNNVTYTPAAGQRLKSTKLYDSRYLVSVNSMFLGKRRTHELDTATYVFYVGSDPRANGKTNTSTIVPASRKRR
jgi:hypothetical protein